MVYETSRNNTQMTVKQIIPESLHGSNLLILCNLWKLILGFYC